jgi:methyl-accepting chemotaxis protein
MRLFRNISINKRIQFVVVSLLFITYALSGYTVFVLSSSRLQKTIHKQSQVYLNNLNAIITEVNKQTDSGFSSQDYVTLKQYFNNAAYYETDYPFMIDANGNYLIHLFREGQRFPRERLNQVYSNQNKNGAIQYTEFNNNKEQKVVLYYQKVDAYNAVICIPVNLEEAIVDIKNNRFILILLVIVGSLIFLVTINYALKPIVGGILKINKGLSKMAEGEAAQTIDYSINDEVGQMAKSLNKLIEGLNRTANFANEIGKNNLSAELVPSGKNDNLGNALISMRDNLKRAAEEEQKRKIEDEQRNWINLGLAKFSDILRQNNNNLQLLSDSITQNLLNYLNANQGGLFITYEEDDEPHLELLSAFAFNRKKFKKKQIAIGEGLVGNCAMEKQTVYLKEIPEGYIEITSGLGDAPPRSLLIVPLKIEDKIFGVIEMASFNEFMPFEIEFVEKIGENIASTLSSVKNSIRTTQLLEQSQQQSEEMAAQEEEMRQNMEEMQATQEEMARKTLEMEGMTAAINEALLFCELAENKSFVHINQNLLNTIGYSKTELEDITFDDIIHPDNFSIFNNAWVDVINGITFKGTLKWKNRDNEEIYILLSITPAFDENGDIFKIFLLGQDVSEAKQIEMRAQEQAEEIELSLMELRTEQELAQERDEEIKGLLLALDNTCLVTEFDCEGKILFINNKNVEILGGSKEQIEGKYHSEIDYFAKNQPEKYKKFWDAICSGQAQQREFSLNVKGGDVWISEHYTPIMDNKGEIVKIINIGIDISAGKNEEIRLRKQIDELTKLITKNNT